jgi:hypothetical protein
MTKLHNDFYTYAFLREDKTPYYIGKGRDKRIYSKHRGVKAPRDKSRIIFLKKNLMEAEAFKHEVYMIFVLGRKDLGTGILRNRTDGGEGSSGAVNSAETKKKKSESKTGENNPMFGVPKTGEWKKAVSERMSGEKNPNYGRTGENHPLFNVPRTEDQKKAVSEKMSGRYLGALSSCSKAIIVIEPDGTKRHYGSVREAARDLVIDHSHLSRYARSGHVLTQGPRKGWQFVYGNSEDF